MSHNFVSIKYFLCPRPEKSGGFIFDIGVLDDYFSFHQGMAPPPEFNQVEHSDIVGEEGGVIRAAGVPHVKAFLPAGAVNRRIDVKLSVRIVRSDSGRGGGGGVIRAAGVPHVKATLPAGAVNRRIDVKLSVRIVRSDR